MCRWLQALAVGGLLIMAAEGREAWCQDEQPAFDPVLGGQSPMDVMLLRAWHEAGHKRCQDADQRIYAVLAVKPDWLGAQAMLLLCDRIHGRHVDEIQHLDRLVAMAPESASWWTQRAMAYASYFYFDRAIAGVGRAIALRPRDESLYELRIKWRAEIEDFKGEFADVEELHELSPQLGTLWVRMADLAPKAVKSDIEELRYREMAEINPIVLPAEVRDDSKLATVAMNRDELMLRAGYAHRVKKFELELRFLNTVLNVEPRYIPALEMRYVLEAGTDLNSVTAASLPSSQTTRPQVSSGARRPASSRNRAQDPRANMMNDLKLLESLSPARWLPVGMAVARANGNDQDELDCFTQVIALDPYDPILYGQRADLELRMKLVDAAIEDYRREIYYAPGSPVGYWSLEQIYRDKKDYEQAGRMLSRASLGEPDNRMYSAEWDKLHKDCPACNF
jgi:tetratricopeptide (TPR) repeat protein